MGLRGSIGRDSRVLIATVIGWGAAFLGIALLSPLLPSIIQSLSLSAFEAGVAMSLAWGLYAVGQFPGGRLSETASRKTVLIGSLVLTTVGCLLLITTASTFLVFLLGTAVMGFGAGLYPSVGIAVVHDTYTSRRGQALGVLVASGDAAGMISGLLAAGLIAVEVWQRAYLPVVGLLVLGTAVNHWWTVGDYGWPSSFDLSIRATLGRLFGTPRLRRETAAFLLWMFAFQATISFLPTFLQVEKGASVLLAGTGFALLWAVGIVVKPVAGRVGDRYGYLRVCGWTMAVSVVGLAALLVATERWQLVVAIPLFAVGLLGTTPNVFAHVTSAMPDASVGGDVGALRTVFFGVGSLGPVYVGYTTDLSSYTLAFGGLGVCLAMAALIMVRLERA